MVHINIAKCYGNFRLQYFVINQIYHIAKNTYGGNNNKNEMWSHFHIHLAGAHEIHLSKDRIILFI